MKKRVFNLNKDIIARSKLTYLLWDALERYSPNLELPLDDKEYTVYELLGKEVYEVGSSDDFETALTFLDRGAVGIIFREKGGYVISLCGELIYSHI